MTGTSTGPRRRGLAVPATLAAAFLVAGCTGAATPSPVPTANSGGTSAAATASAGHQGADAWDVSRQPDPCRTIAASEVSAILGTPVPPSSTLDSWPPLCAFELVRPAVQFLYVTDDSTDNGRTHFDTERTTATAAEPVTGVGDAAYWVPDRTTLHVLEGRTHVVVKFGGSAPPAGARDKAVAVARIVVPRATPKASSAPR